MRNAWLLPLLVSLGTPCFAQPTDKLACAHAYEQAQYAKRDKHLRAARAQSLVCAQQVCGAASATDCGQWLREIDAAMPTVVFAARDDAGADLTRVVVSMDGERLTDKLDGGAVPVDPGSHVFHFDAGGRSVDRSLTINEGEKTRVVSVVIARAPVETAPPAPPTPTPTTSTPPPTNEAPAPPPTTTRGSLAPGLVVGGAGLGLVVSSIVLGVVAKSDLDSLRATCAPSCAPSSLDAVQTKANVSDVLLAVGLAGVGAGALLIVFRPTHHATTTKVGLRGTTLVLSGEF